MSSIIVGIADLKISKSPNIITTIGLGSCVGVTIFDSQMHIGGLVHVLLPSANGEIVKNKAKYADTGIPELIDRLIAMGSKRGCLVAKMAGGASMFTNDGSSCVFNVGQRNVAMSKDVLSKQRIKLISSDTGGNYGRTVELNTENGQLLIKTIGHGNKII